MTANIICGCCAALNSEEGHELPVFQIYCRGDWPYKINKEYPKNDLILKEFFGALEGYSLCQPGFRFKFKSIIFDDRIHPRVHLSLLAAK